MTWDQCGFHNYRYARNWNLRFQRAVVPEEAANLDLNTIDAADASNKMAYIAIYTRFPRNNGTYSCQLVFSRSKVVPDELMNKTITKEVSN